MPETSGRAQVDAALEQRRVEEAQQQHALRRQRGGAQLGTAHQLLVSEDLLAHAEAEGHRAAPA